MQAPKHPKETERLSVLREYGILDTPHEKSFDDLVSLAAEICGVPMCLVSLVDDERQWFKSSKGIALMETALNASICAHAILQEEFFEVADTHEDLRLIDNPLVAGDPQLRFYAGTRLNAPGGLPLGTLCVLDTTPRHLTEGQKASLQIIGRQVMAQLELHKKVVELERERRAREEADSFVRLITDKLPMRVAYLDHEYRYRFINNAYSVRFGSEKEGLLGRTVADVVGQDGFDAVQPYLDRALKGEELTAEFGNPFGKVERILRTSFVPDFDEGGRVRGVVAQTMDVTAQREDQQALVEAREHLDGTLKTAHIATFEWNLGDNLVVGNSLLAEFFDLPFSDPCPIELLFDAIEDGDLSDVQKAIGDCISSGDDFEMEFRIRGAGGRQRTVLFRGHPIAESEGATSLLTGIVLDRTVRATTMRALRLQEQQFRQLVELSPSTVWVAEPGGGLTYISSDFYEATGLTPESALSGGWISAVHPDDLAEVARKWEQAREDQSYYDTEFRLRNRDGLYRWTSVRALPVYDEDGHLVSWIGSNSDITDRKSIEESLQIRVQERTEELQNAVREAEAFNYSISHDLRSPIRAISATAHILLSEAPQDLSEDHLELLRRQSHNASRLGRLIDELLRLSRLARVEVQRVSFDMSAKAESVAEELQLGHRVKVQEAMIAFGDPNLVRTVLQNLISNACKFSPENSLVEIGSNGNAFWVRDRGIGLDLKYVQKIFLPFERLVTEAEFPGTGIGLANVERIIKRHDGKVWVESEPGQGATFFFTLNPA